MGEGTGIAWMIQPQSQDRIDIWNLALSLTHIVPQSHMMQLRYSLGISYTLTVLHHKLHAKYAHVPAPKSKYTICWAYLVAWAASCGAYGGGVE